MLGFTPGQVERMRAVASEFVGVFRRTPLRSLPAVAELRFEGAVPNPACDAG